MWFWRKRSAPLPAVQQVRRASRAVVETMERRCLMSVTSVSVDTGDYVPPGPGDSSGPTPSSLIERVSGLNGTYTFHTDHDDVDGGLAWVAINYGDFVGPIQPILQTAGTWGLSHTWNEEGNYNIAVNVWDASGYSTTTGEAWTGSFNSSGAGVTVMDGQLGNMSSPTTMIPNQTFNGVVGTFADQGVPDVSDYTGIIDWGDGATSAATFMMGDNGAVNIWGTHTYQFQTDPDTGEIQFPLVDPEKYQYDIVTHVTDAGGAALDATNLMAAVLPSHLQMTSVANPNNVNSRADSIIDLSVAAGRTTVYVNKYDGQGKPLDIVGPLFSNIKPLQGWAPAITVTPGPIAKNQGSLILAYTLTAADVGKQCTFSVYDNGDLNCLGFKVVLKIVP